MIVGTSLFKLDGNAYFSPEFGRGGLSALFAIDVTQLSNTNGITFQVQHRNTEDTSFADLSGASDTGSSVGVLSIEATGLKEVIRIKVGFDAADTAMAGAHFLIQPPTWRPY